MTVIARTIALIFAGVSLAAAAESAVDIQLFRFGPGRMDVKAGDRVTWANRDDITHTVTSGVPDRPDGRFDQRLPGKGTTATVEFKDPGVYPYFCTRHPSMRGEVRVN
jgi:plastocyanin